jgi:DNA-binding NarL/FixJ family response regulator
VISVLIVDDQALIRGGLRMIIDAQSDMQVVGEAENGTEAIAVAVELEPDVVLMDIRMPELDGIAATQRLVERGPARTRVLMLTTFDEDQLVYEAMRAGASGFLLKSAPPARLAEAVRVIAAGEALLAPSITRRLVEDFVHRPPPGAKPPAELAELTDREREVLALIARAASPTPRSLPNSSSAKRPSRRTSTDCSANSTSATASKPWCVPTRPASRNRTANTNRTPQSHPIASADGLANVRTSRDPV